MQKKIHSAQLDWRPGNQPVSRLYDDVYFSLVDALAEAEYVFLQHNQLAQRFTQAPNMVVAETGFGAGLNFLAVWQLWQQQAPQGATLHYISFEKHPMTLTDLARCHQAWLDLAELSTVLRGQYPSLLPGWHDLYFADGRVRLTLWLGDALAGLQELDIKVDAWLLDGFSPAKNPEMWQLALFNQLARLSHANTTFATFTAASLVRKGLEQAGFEVKRDKGFGAKREMLYGKLAFSRPHSHKQPWFVRPDSIKATSVIVIGAGLAGAAVAHELADAGLRVTVLEQAEQAAQGASGNLSGALHPLITADWNQRSQWYLLGLQASLARLKPWLDAGEIVGDLSGLVQLAADATILQRSQDALSRVGLPSAFAQWVEAEQASALLGGHVTVGGVFFPQGGWLNPPSIVARCLDHPNIQLVYQQSVAEIKPLDTSIGWQVKTANQVWQADAVVMAGGALDQLNQVYGLPIRPLKGQVSHLKRDNQTWLLKRAMSHLGYSAPAGQNRAVTGATFEAPNLDPTLSVVGHESNLALAKQVAPDWLNAQAALLDGRVGFRPTTPDHMPIIGALPDQAWLQQAYVSQSHTHPVFRYPNQRYQSGLFVSNGHGARGLMSVFLAAKIIKADMVGASQVLPNSLYFATHPARFAIRQWRRVKK